MANGPIFRRKPLPKHQGPAENRGDRSAPRRRFVLFITFLALSFALLATACHQRGEYLAGNRQDRSELRILFGILDSQKSTIIERFASVREISAILLRQKEYGKLASLLTGISSEHPEDPYLAWYLFTAAWCYDSEGAAPIASLYYERIVKTLADLEVDGKSLHYESLQRLIETVTSPERRIEYFRQLITRFQDRVDMGRMLFLLGKEYERVGDWARAVETYARFLPYFATQIPGWPDAFTYARNIVDFYNSPKDWAYVDLNTLVKGIEQAFDDGSATRLRKFRAKVNFFAMSWHQDESDANSQVLFDFAGLMGGGRISYAPELDSSSGTREAYLKTWGWSDRVTTWYLYFRKINFPANPDIHGQWEWAGIYFGEKMQ
jgi:tetratricopeptide (TPR) repeat protein